MAKPTTDGFPGTLRRRDLGLVLAGAAAAAALPATLAGQPAAAQPSGTAPAGAAGNRHRTVRVGAVGATNTAGLLNQLVAGFEAETPYQVDVTLGNTTVLYDQARAGGLDLVVTHLGVAALEEFVRDGAGRWPRLFLATSFTFAAATADPAGIAGAADPVEAFGRIADTRSPFVVNNLDQPRFVTDVLWHAAGQPDPGNWFLDPGVSGPAAAQQAAQRGGYMIWGLHPLLGFLQQQPPPPRLRPVLFADALFQRVVGAVVVKPSWHRRVNLAGALALTEFLTEPATQARIRAFRHPMLDVPIFWPAAHHNSSD